MHCASDIAYDLGEGRYGSRKEEIEMSKLDDTMRRFEAVCAKEAEAVAALVAAEEALKGTHEAGAAVLEKIEIAQLTLDNAKAVMAEAADALREQIDNAAFNRPHTRAEAWEKYTKARDAVSDAKIAQNALNESAVSLSADIDLRKKAISAAKIELTRAQRGKVHVAEELRPLVASEVAGYTGKRMRPRVVEGESERVALVTDDNGEAAQPVSV